MRRIEKCDWVTGITQALQEDTALVLMAWI